jgi:hypothetical protein
VDSSENSRRLFAIDNIDITSCDYPASEIDPDNSLISFSCNFDDLTMCGMINDGGSPISIPTYNFTVYTGETVPNKDLGPTRDHTSNSTTGGFLYLDQKLPFTVKDYGVVCPLKTIEQNSGMCVRFAYYVKSTAINKNGTMVSVSPGGCYATTLWYRSLDDSDGWQTVVVPVLNDACAETFYFDVYQVEPTYVSVAFDDIEIDQCSTFDPTTTTSTSTTTTTTSTMAPTTTTARPTETSSKYTVTSTTPESISTTTPEVTTPSNAHRLLSLNGYNLIIIYVLTQVFRGYFLH